MASKPLKDDSGPSLEAFDLALRIISSACGVTPTFILSPHAKGGCTVSAALNGSEAAFRVNVNVDGLTEPVEVPTEYFTSTLKGHKQGTLVMKGTTLLIKSGTYEAKVNTNEAQAVSAITVPEGDGVHQFVLTPDVHQFLSAKLPQVRIERVHSALPDVMLNFRASAKSWYLATYDAQQMCFLTSKAPADIGNLKILLPYNRFSSFIKDLPVANCKVYVTENVLVAISPQFRLCIALPHFEEGTVVDPDETYARAKDFKVAEGKSFSISASQLSGFLENSRSFFSVGSEVNFAPAKGGKGTEISVISAAGSAKLKVAGDTVEEAFGLDYRFVQTLLSKQPKKAKGKDAEDTTEDDSITFDLVDNSFVLCRSTSTYVALLTASASAAAKEE